MTKVINFFGGPSVGKTTIASELFGKMKSKNMSVEYVPEFAKELTWNKSESLKDQLYVFGTQHQKIYGLLGKVDYIITDSPILLSIPYLKYSDRGEKYKNSADETWKEMFEDLIYEIFNKFDNINFYVERDKNKTFEKIGRNETLRQCKELDYVIYDMVQDFSPITISKSSDIDLSKL